MFHAVSRSKGRKWDYCNQKTKWVVLKHLFLSFVTLSHDEIYFGSCLKWNMFFQVVREVDVTFPEHTNGKSEKEKLRNYIIRFFYMLVEQATCTTLLFLVEHWPIQEACRCFCQILATKMYRCCSPFAQEAVCSLKLTPPLLSCTELSQHSHLDHTFIFTGFHTIKTLLVIHDTTQHEQHNSGSAFTLYSGCWGTFGLRPWLNLLNRTFPGRTL